MVMVVIMRQYINLTRSKVRTSHPVSYTAARLVRNKQGMAREDINITHLKIRMLLTLKYTITMHIIDK
jgi:hypothetical protein